MLIDAAFTVIVDKESYHLILDWHQHLREAARVIFIFRFSIRVFRRYVAQTRQMSEHLAFPTESEAIKELQMLEISLA